MTFKKIGVFINTHSGCFSKDQVKLDDIKSEFEKYHPYYSGIHYFPAKKQNFNSQLQRLREYEPDLAVVAGGDGTVGALVNSYPTQDNHIAIIPCGTFNHFAVDAGIPTTMQDAVHSIFNGSPVKLDAAAVNKHRFINNSSIGLYPHSVEVRDKLENKYGYNRFLFLIIAFFRIFRRFPLYKINLKLNGKQEQHVTSSLFVGNNKYEVELLKFGSRESLQDGKLSLYYSKCRNRWGFLRNAFFLLIGKLEQAKNFEFLLVDRMDLETTKNRVRVSADGEIYKLEPPLVYTSIPGAVNVILPKKKS